MASEPDIESCILAVDDDPVNLKILSSTLRRLDCRFLTASDGQQALAVAARDAPDLVLLDVMMPDLDGFEVCARLKADPATADAAVIFLSGVQESEDKVRGFEVGAVDFINKPFDPREVIARVENHLRIRHLEKSLKRKNEQLREVNRRMHLDFEAAALVQQSFLPTTEPEVDNASFAWAYRPCERLAGDYLNVVAFDHCHAGLYVVDVSGHGVASSLLTVSIARSLGADGTGASQLLDRSAPPGRRIVSPDEVARRLNRLYPMDSRRRLYFTFLYGILDTENGRFEFVSAGNPGPIVARAGGPIEVHEVPGVPIGMLPTSDYENTVIELAPGDRLYLHSDGLSDERSPADDVFGQDRVVETIAASTSLSIDRSIDALVQAVVSWRGSPSLSDDVAVVAAEFGVADEEADGG
jgi:sigma-B regulation protein RsbU (phosphoserine phosphatase)